MTNQHDIAEECEHRLDGFGTNGSYFDTEIVAEIKADLARYAAHMRQQAAEIERLKTYKEFFGEYATCLQKLCMEKLYERCKPVSYKWPGKKHVDSIVEAADFLLARIATLEKLVREAMPVMQAAKSDIEAYTADFKGFEPERDFVTRWLYAAREAAGEGD